jgi:hypothetical protein
MGYIRGYYMGRVTRKLNFLIENDICHDLEALVPAGKRSKIVNNALRKELELIRRKRAVARLLDSASGGKHFCNRDIVEGLAKDRGVH